MNPLLVIAPVLLPFATGVLLLALRDLPKWVRRGIALMAMLVQIVLAACLLEAVSGGEILVYRLGHWPAPWGIVLVADRLAAWLVLSTALLAPFAMLHCGSGIDRSGRHFHVLFQMQLFGLNGAFLTGDLFNLFVFFEILLMASYGLLLHGGGPERTRAGLHYVIINVLGSSVFLLAAGLCYGILGTLNFADLALKLSAVPPENLALARMAGLLLLGVFALKAALLPLHLWLPAAYASACPPAAALFAIMTKVGAYAILRCQTLLFGSGAGALAGLFEPWLLPLALATLLTGMMGALSARALARQVAWLVVASAGTLLAAFALGSAPGIAAGLYYLPHSTFASALFFLLAAPIARRRGSGDALVPDVDVGNAGLWGGLFFVAALLIAGLPPLAGFLGKFMLLRAANGHSAQVWIWGVVLAGAFCGLVALARSGSLIFLRTRPGEIVRLAPEWWELLPVAGLIALGVALTVFAGAAFEFTQAAANQLVQPADYIAAVLGDKR